MQYLNQAQMDEFHKNGFLVLKNVLSPAEVETLRNITTNFFTKREDEIVFIYSGKTKPNAINSISELSCIFHNQNVVGIMKDLCGDNVRYGHHSDVHFNMLSGWHKDNYGSDDWAKGVRGETYQCYKMAFYLQDHSTNSDGLTVYKGSHLSKDLKVGQLYDIPSQPGDAVVFDMRISHVGKQPNKVEKMIQLGLKSDKARFKLFQNVRNLMGIKDKISVFFAFGVPNQFTDEHIRKNIDRQNKQNKATSYTIHPDVANALDKAGIDYQL